MYLTEILVQHIKCLIGFSILFLSANDIACQIFKISDKPTIEAESIAIDDSTVIVVAMEDPHAPNGVVYRSNNEGVSWEKLHTILDESNRKKNVSIADPIIDFDSNSGRLIITYMRISQDSTLIDQSSHTYLFALNSDIYYIESFDKGNTWSKPNLVYKDNGMNFADLPELVISNAKFMVFGFTIFSNGNHTTPIISLIDPVSSQRVRTYMLDDLIKLNQSTLMIKDMMLSSDNIYISLADSSQLHLVEYSNFNNFKTIASVDHDCEYSPISKMIEFNDDLYFLLYHSHRIDSPIKVIRFDKRKNKFKKSKEVFYGAYPTLYPNGKFLSLLFNQKTDDNFKISSAKFDRNLKFIDSTVVLKKQYDSYTSGEYQSIVDLHKKTILIFVDWSDKSLLKSMDISNYFHQN